MVLRFIIRLLSNNEQLVQKLSESYPMRRAAQFAVRIIFQSRNLIEQHNLDKKLNPAEFRAAIRGLGQQLQSQIKSAQDDFKRKMK